MLILDRVYRPGPSWNKGYCEVCARAEGAPAQLRARGDRPRRVRRRRVPAERASGEGVLRTSLPYVLGQAHGDYREPMLFPQATAHDE
ncbi:MAG: hypothetical protein M5T61_18595 [Acidimicrobiia bacterium]|nr:hypothetical protein [Acidimicrobiia bacterium]